MSGEQWPFRDQRKNPTARARHVAGMYRTALGLTNPELVQQIDSLVNSYGETWIQEKVIPYDDDDLISRADVAEILGVSTEAVRQYQLRGRLAAYQTDGGWRYRAGDVRQFRAAPRGRRPAKEELT